MLILKLMAKSENDERNLAIPFSLYLVSILSLGVTGQCTYLHLLQVLWVDSASVAASSMTATEAMLQAMDQLVLGELKKRVPRLARIKDRTDPMLAVYPGGGARFQKHVDNTARDGRRLTVHK
jgi:hypothetical protein